MFFSTCLCVVWTLIAGAWAESIPITYGGTYPGGSGGTHSGGYFLGFKPPEDTTTYPLFMWLPGESDKHDAPVYQQMTYQMAMRGFVSVSVDYDKRTDIFSWIKTGDLCNWGSELATSIFEGPGSALETLCGQTAYVDCSKGVAVAGIGAGGFITILAQKNNVTSISAKLAFAVGMCDDTASKEACHCHAASPCLKYVTGDITKQRLVTGADDMYIAKGIHSTTVESMKKMSGYFDCGDENDCLKADGSGYYIVTGSDYVNASCDKATHALITTKERVSKKAELLCDFLSSSPWGLSSNFDWLAKTATGTAKETPPLTFEGVPLACTTECGEQQSLGCEFYDKVGKLNLAIVAMVVACCCCCVGIILALCCCKGGKRRGATNEDDDDEGEYEGEDLEDEPVE